MILANNYPHVTSRQLAELKVTIHPGLSGAVPEIRLLCRTNFVPEFNPIFFIAPILFCFPDVFFRM